MDKYTPRERVLKVINHEEADRVPIDVGSTAASFVDPVFFKLRDHFNIKTKLEPFRPWEGAAYYDDDLLEALSTDFRHLYLLPPSNFSIDVDKDGTFRDVWGVKRRKMREQMEIAGHPLKEAKTIEDIDNYPYWPDIHDAGRIKGLKERAEYLYYKTDYAIASRVPSHGIFELSWELRGMDNLLVDMMVNKEFANHLLDKVLEMRMGLYDLLLTPIGKYLQIVETCDDYGTQIGPIMSPSLYREMIKPRRKKLNDFIKSKAPQAKIFYHTCGSVFELIPDIIETGVDILNPIQPSAKDMDSFKLKKEFGDLLCFHGGIDVQTSLRGSKADVEKEVKTRIKALAPGGGYILATTTNAQIDIPVENILYWLEIAKKFGRYPIEI
jgi:uroporphyrinogen decarboxylase